ncbi:MAG: HD domain-containing protein [Chloroflexota bacterium]|nr:HD domain-containing protein [Chloroflexota bacterium]
MECKAGNPVNLLDGDDINPIIHAYFEFNHLKQLYRRGWLKSGIPRERCETVAEHSLGVAVLACWLAEAHYPDLDFYRVIRMALIHDFGEIYAGDIIPEDGIPSQEKHDLESRSVQQVFKGFPNAKEYTALWQEFEAGITAEARFVRQVDRLEMALQASVYERQGYPDLDEFFKTVDRDLLDTQLRSLLREILDLRVE